MNLTNHPRTKANLDASSDRGAAVSSFPAPVASAARVADDADQGPPALLRGTPAAPDRCREADLRDGAERANLRDRAMELIDGGLTQGDAAQLLGVSQAKLSRLLRGERATASAAELATASRPGRPAAFDVPRWFVPAARLFWLISNRTEFSGSIPEAVRRTVSLPACPPQVEERLAKALKDFVEAGELGENPLTGRKVLPACPEELRRRVIARQEAGQPLVPERLARQIRASAAVVKQQRNPTEATLTYLSAPGSMVWIMDKATGGQRPARAGEIIEADDATINFPVCVPWTLGGDPCSERYGVKVGRFQWLVTIDAASRFVTAYSYVMRPRSSYRAEDSLSLMHGHCAQHGIPTQWRFEQGAWKSNLVRHAIAAMGSELVTVHSPRSKPYIEGLFNVLWTKLSVWFPDAHVGRFMAENEQANDVLTACKAGHRDPRQHFPMLADALTAFNAVIAEKNSTTVEADFGRFVPRERWQLQRSTAAVRWLDRESAWLFAPYVREWTVRGMLVGGRVPLFEDLSVPFDFSSSWLANFDGARVRVHFDPSEPQCTGMLVLAQNHGDHKAGEILGPARQINEIAGYARLVMGWAEDPQQAGRQARQVAAAALRREVRGIIPAGRGVQRSEQRDGVAGATKIEVEGGQRTEDGGRRTESGGQKTEDGGRRTVIADRVVTASRPAAEDPTLAEFLD
jgi:hypothetical protein